MRVWEALKEGTEKLLKAFAPVFYLWIVLYKILCIVLNYRTPIMWSLKTSSSTNDLTSDLLSFSILESYCGDYYYCCAIAEKGTAIRIPIKRIAAASNADGSSCIWW
jgi:hypothetical protein